MENYIIIFLLGLYLIVLGFLWVKCLVFIIKDFLRGGKNEDI